MQSDGEIQRRIQICPAKSKVNLDMPFPNEMMGPALTQKMRVRNSVMLTNCDTKHENTMVAKCKIAQIYTALTVLILCGQHTSAFVEGIHSITCLAMLRSNATLVCPSHLLATRRPTCNAERASTFAS